MGKYAARPVVALWAFWFQRAVCQRAVCTSCKERFSELFSKALQVAGLSYFLSLLAR